MKRPQGNLLDWLRGRRKPKPQMVEISMSDYSELMALVDALVAAYTDAKAKIQALESTNAYLNRQIAGMEAEMSADAVTKATAINKIKGVLDGGFSAGGVPATSHKASA